MNRWQIARWWVAIVVFVGSMGAGLLAQAPIAAQAASNPCANPTALGLRILDPSPGSLGNQPEQSNPPDNPITYPSVGPTQTVNNAGGAVGEESWSYLVYAAPNPALTNYQETFCVEAMQSVTTQQDPNKITWTPSSFNINFQDPNPADAANGEPPSLSNVSFSGTVSALDSAGNPVTLALGTAVHTYSQATGTGGTVPVSVTINWSGSQPYTHYIEQSTQYTYYPVYPYQVAAGWTQPTANWYVAAWNNEQYGAQWDYTTYVQDNYYWYPQAYQAWVNWNTWWLYQYGSGTSYYAQGNQCNNITYPWYVENWSANYGGWNCLSAGDYDDVIWSGSWQWAGDTQVAGYNPGPTWGDSYYWALLDNQTIGGYWSPMYTGDLNYYWTYYYSYSPSTYYPYVFPATPTSYTYNYLTCAPGNSWNGGACVGANYTPVGNSFYQAAVYTVLDYQYNDPTVQNYWTASYPPYTAYYRQDYQASQWSAALWSSTWSAGAGYWTPYWTYQSWSSANPYWYLTCVGPWDTRGNPNTGGGCAYFEGIWYSYGNDWYVADYYTSVSWWDNGGQYWYGYGQYWNATSYPSYTASGFSWNNNEYINYGYTQPYWNQVLNTNATLITIPSQLQTISGTSTGTINLPIRQIQN